MPAIADSRDTQQSASSGISHDPSHSSWKEVGHAVWSKDGEKKRSSSASISTPRRSVKGVMSPARKEKPNRLTLKQEVEEAKRNLAMLQESYERDDQGNVTRIQELERRAGSPHPQKMRRTTSRSCSIHRHSTWEDKAIRRSGTTPREDLRTKPDLRSSSTRSDIRRWPRP